MSWEFLLISLVIVLSPGTGAIFTIVAGLSGGAAASVRAAAGCTLGIVPHIIAAVSGAAAVFHTSPYAFELLRYAGVFYLLNMAWSTFRNTKMFDLESGPAGSSQGRLLSTAVLINLFNPKLSIFFLAFLPQFIDKQGSPFGQMMLLSAVFMVLTFLVFAIYGVLASSLRTHVFSSAAVQTWMRRSFAATFALLAIQLAFTAR